MSRGLGRIQRCILVLIAKEGRSITSTYLIAEAVRQRKPPKLCMRSLNPVLPAEVNSAHRALTSLHRKGLVFKTTRRAGGHVYWGSEIAVLEYLIGNEEPEIIGVNPHLLCHLDKPQLSDARTRCWELQTNEARAKAKNAEAG